MAEGVFVVVNDGGTEGLVSPFVISGVCELVILTNKHTDGDSGDVGDVELRGSWLVIDLLVGG